MKTRNRFRSPLRRQSASHSRGSTLLIVVALMGMLAFLGFAFYTLAVQERANALSFAQEAKTTKAPSLEPDALFDFALQQVIIGPDDAYTQSILWGGRNSLMANMYGRDRVPFNGEGVNLASESAPSGSPGLPVVDMNFDGTQDSGANANPNLLFLVDSPVANGGTKWGSNSIYLSGARNPATNLPDPDVNYTSPDINNLFISYDGVAVDASGSDVDGSGRRRRIIVPSYFRPQFLRMAGTMPGDPAQFISDWYSSDGTGPNPATTAKVFRPHPGHICVDSAGSAITLSGGTPVRRYVNATEYQSLGLRRPFTSSSGSFAPQNPDGSASNGTLGLWSGAGTNPLDIDLDVDTDGDGILDAILMDLGYPPIRRGDGKLVVPLFAISIRDLNGLLNVNATGNLSGNLNLSTLSSTNQLGYRKTGLATYVADSLSKSNQGLSTYEINIQRALTADPLDSLIANSEAGQQLAYFLKLFDSTITTSSPTQPGRSVSELANLEWLLLNIGRAQFHLGLATSTSPLQDAITDVFSGRNGEVLQSRYDGVPVVGFDTSNNPVLSPDPFPTSGVAPSNLRKFLTTRNLFDLPKAGLSLTWKVGSPVNWPPVGSYPSPDDNGNFNEGEAVTTTRWVHPLDFRGSGQQYKRYAYGPDGQPGQASVDDDGNGVVDDFTEEGWTGSDDTAIQYGKAPELYRNGANLWPSYSGYHSFGTVRWGENQGATSYHDKVMRGSSADSLLDDPAEAIIDPTLMSPNYSGYSSLSNARDNDTVFGPEEMPFLQGSESDGRLSDAQSRLADLMPANLVASKDAADIRKRLTTVSSDRREYGYGTSVVGGLRSWETTDTQFPPTLVAGTGNPYRAELFSLLRQQGTAGVSNWQMRLNVNQLLTNNGGGQLQFRALANHDTTGVMTAAANVTAHNERQLMARDIYTLLYTLCQGVDTDYRSPAAPAVAKAREMAQFAVNLVDELDTDDIITAFSFDPDLTTGGSGWNNDYSGTDGQPGVAGTDDNNDGSVDNASEAGWPGSDDTVVYGVERQLLAFSEALAIRVNRCATSTSNSEMTIFDDAATDAANGRRYVFFELQNVTPMNVALATTAAVDANTSIWRVTLQNGANAAKSRVHFLSGLYNNYSTLKTDLTLPPGALFTVGSQDGTDTCTGGHRTSDFRSDTDAPPNGSSYERIVPRDGTADIAGGRVVPTDTTAQAQFPTPKCDLDLVWDAAGYPTNAFVLETSPTTSGAFAASLDAGTTMFRLVLERRASNGIFQAVDQTKSQNVVTVTPPDSPAMATDVTAQLALVVSQERRTPLSRKSETDATAAAPRRNTFKTANGDSTATLWQHHNDRDFASLADLFQIPLYGPERLTDGRLGDREFADRTADLDASASTDPIYDSTNNATYIPVVAAARFLNPSNPDQTGASNRWYRLLEFLEVPNRSHQYATIRTQSALTTPVPTMLAEPYNLPIGYGWPRTHGQLNLNMIRHPQALAALLDDDLLINGGTTNLTGLDEATRLWWVQFLKARDSRSTGNFAVDPVTNLYVPGTGNSRPFRGFDSVGPMALGYGADDKPGKAGVDDDSNGTMDDVSEISWAGSDDDAPLENTILRSLPFDGSSGGNPNEFRRLFEVGTSSEHQKLVADEADATKTHLHPAARYRLLSKLLNNVTTRSNSFGVFVTVQYYEAAQVEGLVAGVSTTATRIGGRLDDTPTHRGYFVVDRTGAVEQMKVLTANPVSSNSFSFKANTNQTGTPNGIRWKDLILFRKTLN